MHFNFRVQVKVNYKYIYISTTNLAFFFFIQLLIKYMLWSKKGHIYLQNVTEWKHQVAEHGNSQVKHMYRNILE